jgi:hypothetical protein
MNDKWLPGESVKTVRRAKGALREGDDDMLKDEVCDCVANINYWAIYENTPDRAMVRILGKYIYDPITRVFPMERVRQIREALASSDMLSEIGLPPDLRKWSEEAFRDLLTQLVDRIEFYESSGLPKIQDDNELSERQLEELGTLVQPLAETSTLSDAIKTFEEKVLPDLDGYIARMNAEVLVRYVLWFDTGKILPIFFTPEVTDSTFREYLRNIAWKIKDAGRP